MTGRPASTLRSDLLKNIEIRRSEYRMVGKKATRRKGTNAGILLKDDVMMPISAKKPRRGGKPSMDRIEREAETNNVLEATPMSGIWRRPVAEKISPAA